MWAARKWTDYELLDAGRGEKLERWGKYILRRPDPQAIWPANKNAGAWGAADAVYARSSGGGGRWDFNTQVPESWTIGYGVLRLRVKPMQFKHTGVFPEQAANWDWAAEKIRASGKSDIKVLNLFAYTGAATAAAAAAGAAVCHVDAARGMLGMAKENAVLSSVPARNTRFIVDDVFKFVRRELRRGSRYDAIIMDPPAYGRGPDGELWKAEDQLSEIIDFCAGLLSEAPLFFLVSSYASGISAVSIENTLKVALKGKHGGRTESGELGLPVSSRKKDGIFLPCGCAARWERG